MVFFKAKEKRQTTFWKTQDYDYFVIIVSEKNIAKIKLLMLNAARFLKVKDDFKVINRIIPAYSEHHCITTK